MFSARRVAVTTISLKEGSCSPAFVVSSAAIAPIPVHNANTAKILERYWRAHPGPLIPFACNIMVSPLCGRTAQPALFSERAIHLVPDHLPSICWTPYLALDKLSISRLTMPSLFGCEIFNRQRRQLI